MGNEIIYSKLDSKPVCYCVVCYGWGDQTLCDADPNCEYSQPRNFGPYSTEQEATDASSTCPVIGQFGACPC